MLLDIIVVAPRVHVYTGRLQWALDIDGHSERLRKSVVWSLSKIPIRSLPEDPSFQPSPTSHSEPSGSSQSSVPRSSSSSSPCKRKCHLPEPEWEDERWRKMTQSQLLNCCLKPREHVVDSFHPTTTVIWPLVWICLGIYRYMPQFLGD